VDPSKPTEPQIDPQTSIPRSRDGADEALVGEVIPKRVPLGRPTVNAEPQQPARPAPPKGRLRRAFVVVAALAVGLCLAGVVVAYALYDKATKPDRSSPAVVLTQYIDTKFGTRDEARIKNFECASPSLTEVDQLFADLRDREQRFNITIQVTTSDFNVVSDGDKATIDATVKIAVPEDNGGLSRSLQQWQFSLVDSGGWRVCGAHRLS
jgi:hypothetical protein